MMVHGQTDHVQHAAVVGVGERENHWRSCPPRPTLGLGGCPLGVLEFRPNVRPVSSHPRARPAPRVAHQAGHKGHVLLHLEVEHADTDEVGAVLEGVTETGFRPDGAGGEGLEGDPGLLHLLHEVDGSLGVLVPVVVVAVVDDISFLIGASGGPVTTVVQGLDVEIGVELQGFALDNDLNSPILPMGKRLREPDITRDAEVVVSDPTASAAAPDAAPAAAVEARRERLINRRRFNGVFMSMR
jgi:hypothetical protein